MKVGIVGTGNMGKIIIEAFIESGAISPSNLNITNRTIEKAEEIQKIHENIRVLPNNADIIKQSDLVFLCVKPHDIYSVIKENEDLFTEDKCVVSITSPISLEQLDSVLSCSTARIIPSITNRALSGVSLVTFGNQCTTHWKEKLYEITEKISTPVEIDQSITRVSSDIVSCGPAFFSYLTQRFIQAAVSETEIDQETATTLASEMLIGLGELLQKGIFTLPTLQEKVCVKGGVTGVGIAVMEQELGDVFEKLFQGTHDKFEEDINQTKSQFGL